VGNFSEPVVLGRTGLRVGRLGITAVDCYRFVLSHPAVDVCMTGAKTLEQMRENLAVFDSGPMSEDELARMRRIGDHVHGRKRG